MVCDGKNGKGGQESPLKSYYWAEKVETKSWEDLWWSTDMDDRYLQGLLFGVPVISYFYFILK